MKSLYITVAVAAASLAPTWGWSANCMVLGARDAKVQSVEGEKSPAFLTKDCAALRLISGNAQASWVGQDGKPRLIPITVNGVAAQPNAGAEERSVTVVWSELTTKRERQQAAYMRSVSFERAQKIYIPAEGLVLLDRSDVDAELSVQLVKDSATVPVLTQAIKKGESLRVERKLLEQDQTYVFTIRRGDATETWRWKTLPADQTATIDGQLEPIRSAPLDAEQRLMLQAMLFDQIKFRPNMELTIQQLKALEDAKAR
ncbi:hypothetical protein RQP54_11680 [Curvibacter sp. APW13]|uniref:hypothetical protein n=1 Tax=Curvibacter sp. APW13 TaxID=3077236 RepID=UPI0028DF98CF|nr:hypothetical protein [Curvibacter sp. APW13]MDT8991521.1 hypothetical protein [Curvibacter sp. APW13]